jgi:hypothetical protein
MAQLYAQDSPTQTLSTNYPVRYIIAIGATLGILFWGLNAWVNYYVVEQLLCRSSATLTACSNSVALSGSIATIIVGVIGVLLLVRARIRQPLVVATASAILLWTLATWTDGLAWYEVVIYSIGLYILSYGLFSWITRYRSTPPALLATLLAIGIIRIILIL